MSRIFLTGHSGFIGQALLPELLGAGHQLSTISRSNPILSGLHASLEQKELVLSYLQRQKPEVAILLAWQDLPDYSLNTSLINLNQQVQLVEMLASVGCKRIILAGSCWQYGQQQGSVRECTLPYQPGFFGCAKNAVLQLSQAICSAQQIELAEARIFYCYGPGQRTGSLLPTLVLNVKQRQPLNIRTPHAAVDFVHVTDVVQGLLCLVNSTQVSGVYNLGSGEDTTVAEVVNMALQELGLPVKYSTPTAQTAWRADISRLMQLGFKPRMPISEGIRQLIATIK